MAYTKNRGVTLCNSVALNKIETSDEPVVQCLQDLKKAFNVANRSTIVLEAQKKFGAGKLFKTWFEHRTFRDPFGKRRGIHQNAGVPAGTLFGVEGFLLFIATNESLSGKNKDLLIDALYADDESPGAPLSKVQDGSFQKALDNAFQWAKDQGVNFHMEGDKGPKFMAFLKKGHSYPAEFDSIKLGPVVFEPSPPSLVKNPTAPIQHDPLHMTTKLLGLVIRSRGKSTSGTKFMDKYGYEIDWNTQKIRPIGHRFQAVKYEFAAERLENMINAYLGGNLRFCACIKWLRAPIDQQNQCRYSYCIAILASLGLDPAEGLNLSITKQQAISEKNKLYVDLINDTGFPTLLEMAERDAYTTIKQWQEFDDSIFLKPKPGSQLARKTNKRRKNNLFLPLKTIAPGLASDILDLALSYEEKREKRREENRKKMLRRTDKKVPKYVPPAKKRLLEVLAYTKDWSLSQRDSQKLLTITSRIKYKCFEASDRLCNFKESISLQVKRTREHSDDILSYSDWKTVTHRLKPQEPVFSTPASKFLPLTNKYSPISYDINGGKAKLVPRFSPENLASVIALPDVMSTPVRKTKTSLSKAKKRKKPPAKNSKPSEATKRKKSPEVTVSKISASESFLEQNTPVRHSIGRVSSKIMRDSTIDVDTLNTSKLSSKRKKPCSTPPDDEYSFRGFNKNVFKIMKIECKVCGCDITFQKKHAELHCNGTTYLDKLFKRGDSFNPP